ncbi:hypothetical protein EVAR_83393_1 [Eumeta japonica]|uniref:Uncharacterized protein n=1 Tax=Eumeta variegata TaxID=151549 RepID=A0A4C1TYK0_EUMVA|nr:hypothetical protein EVAR_83393_1 [Eumeta japonica]
MQSIYVASCRGRPRPPVHCERNINPAGETSREAPALAGPHTKCGSCRKRHLVGGEALTKASISKTVSPANMQ